MKNITNSKKHLKALPLITVLALGLAMAPMASMAGNGDRGHHKAGHSNSSGKHHNKGQYRSEKQSYREPRHNSHKRSPGHKLGHNHGDRYGSHHNRGHDKHVRYYPRYDRHYDHRGHDTTHYVVNDYYHSDHYVGLDRLGFMLCLHTNNFDITFRD